MSHFEVNRARLFPASSDGRASAQAAGLGALCDHLDEAERTRLQRRAAGDKVLHDREARLVGETLARAGIRCARWKGVAIAALWPIPALRPVGDLDLLVEADAIEAAAAALCQLGYRRAPGESDGRFRRGAAAVELLPPPPGRVVVDLHARPFRSVGHRIDAEVLIARAAPCGDDPLPWLAPLDHALLVLVHAAKHGLAHPKWRLDVAAVADHFSLEALLGVAREHGLGRALRSVLAAVGACPAEKGPSARLLAEVLRARAPAAARDRLPRVQRYLLELLLEESVRARLRMGLGFLEGRARGRDGCSA